MTDRAKEQATSAEQSASSNEVDASSSGLSRPSSHSMVDLDSALDASETALERHIITATVTLIAAESGASHTYVVAFIR